MADPVIERHPTHIDIACPCGRVFLLPLDGQHPCLCGTVYRDDGEQVVIDQPAGEE